MKQHGKVYQCCVIPVPLYSSETWKLIVTDKWRLCGVGRHMNKIVLGIKLASAVSNDFLTARMIVRIKDMLIHSHLCLDGHAVCLDTNSQIFKFMVLEVSKKRE